MNRAFKYRIYPTGEQEILIKKTFGSIRYIYNKALELKNKTYLETGESLSCFDLINGLLTEEKSKNEWLCEPPSQSLQMSLRNLDTAFTNFFKKRSEFPKYKKRKNNQSFQVPQGVTVDFVRSKIKFPKLGEIPAVLHREFPKGWKICTCTLSQNPSGQFFISVLTDDLIEEKPQRQPFEHSNSVGVDLGVKDFAVLSTGEKIANPKFLKKYEQRLAVLQRKASRKKSGSKNRQKANKRVAKLYQKIANCRKDFHHKLSYRLVSENQAIAIEDLSISTMVKNPSLAKAISDCGWFQFRSFLDYKAEWFGKTILTIGRFEPSSKMCSCGAINDGLKLSDRVWTCSICGITNDRDVLAANNIKKFAFAYRNLDLEDRIKNQGRTDPKSLRSRGGLKPDAEVGTTLVETKTSIASN